MGFQYMSDQVQLCNERIFRLKYLVFQVDSLDGYNVPADEVAVWIIRKASLFFGGRSEKRLGRSSPPQNGGIGGTMALL